MNVRTVFLWLLLAALTHRAGAQTITLGQNVTANFASVAEFQTLSGQGWIFRPGAGVGADTCATPGNVDACGWGFASVGGVQVAQAKAAGNTAGRWIITPPIQFGPAGSVTFVLRKEGFGAGGFDTRESGGGSDTGKMQDNGPEARAPDGSAPCPVGTGSFCAARRVRTSGDSNSALDPSCNAMFSAASPGVRTQEFCTFTIFANELQDFGTGLHRLAFMMRTGSGAGQPNLIIDSININTTSGTPIEGAYLYNDLPSTTPLGLLRHPITQYSAGVITSVGAPGLVDMTGMDFSPSGVLYGITGAAPQQLVQINAATGDRVSIGALSGFLVAGEFTQDFSIDPITGQAIVLGRNFSDLQSRLYFLNLSNGNLTLQAGINAGGAFKASAYAIDCAGRLFAVETTNSAAARLYRVNRIDGSVSLIGNTGYGSSIQHGAIDFDNATGTLYGWAQATSGAMVGYGSYGLGSGAFTVIGANPQYNAGAGALNSKCWGSYQNGFEN
jgi:hypothetical protein